MFLGLAGLVSSFPAAVSAGEPEPVMLRDQYPLAVIHLELRPRSAEVLEPGSVEFGLLGAWSNTYNLQENLLVDCEHREAELSLRAGVLSGLEASAFLPVMWRGGGTFDHLIREWDRTLGVPNRDRDLRADNMFEISGKTRDGRGFGLGPEGYGLGNLVLSLKESVIEDGGLRLALYFDTSLPTASDGFGHDSVDFLGGALLSGTSGRFGYAAGTGVSWFLSPELQGIPYADKRLSGFLYGDYSFAERWTVFAGVYGASRLLVDVPGDPGYDLYFDLGPAYRISDTLRLALLVRENPIHSYASTDITVAISGAFRLER